MSKLSITTDFTGEISVLPRIVKIITDDSFSTITTAGYLNSRGFTFYPTDIAAVAYGTNSATTQFFSLSIAANGVITLVPMAGDVTLPVTANHIAVYANTSGGLTEDAATAINGGNIQAGLSGTAGSLISFPSTATSGSLALTAVANSGNFTGTISNRSLGQSTTFSLGDPGQSTASILTSTVNADPGANLIAFDITVTSAALATGGSVVIVNSSGAKSYKIRNIMINGGGTNFSGGGGNRNIVLTDSSQNFTIIPAATLQALTNATWGSTAVPFPVADAANVSTIGGQPLQAFYNGGTTDYLAGSVVITVLAQRVA